MKWLLAAFFVLLASVDFVMAYYDLVIMDGTLFTVVGIFVGSIGLLILYWAVEIVVFGIEGAPTLDWFCRKILG